MSIKFPDKEWYTGMISVDNNVSKVEFDDDDDNDILYITPPAWIPNRTRSRSRSRSRTRSRSRSPSYIQ